MPQFAVLPASSWRRDDTSECAHRGRSSTYHDGLQFMATPVRDPAFAPSEREGSERPTFFTHVFSLIEQGASPTALGITGKQPQFTRRGGDHMDIPHTATNDAFERPGQRAAGPEKRRDAASLLANGTSQSQ